MLHCVIPLFGYLSLSGTPSCLYHTMQHKGRDKNSFWPQRSQSCHISLVCRLGRCCFELLKAMWNYLTKAWEEVPNLPLCCYLGDSLMSSEYHLHSHTMFPRALGEDAVQQFGVWKEVVGLTRRPNLMDSPKPHAISSPEVLHPILLLHLSLNLTFPPFLGLSRADVFKQMPWHWKGGR